MEFRNELREDCYWCHGKLTPHISETVMGKCGDKEIIFKNVPRLECKKCSFYYSAEPFQEQKNQNISRAFEITALFKRNH